MEFQTELLYAFLLALTALAGGVFIGWLLERFALRRWLKDSYIFGALKAPMTTLRKEDGMKKSIFVGRFQLSIG